MHMLDETTRLQYLQAMGVEVWLPRTAEKTASGVCEKNQAIEKLETPSVDLLTAAEQEKPSATEEEISQWQSLQQQITECRACALCQSRTQTVFGTGNKQADWMLIGEAPGYHEDQEGKPFVGKAGLLLTEMIRALGLEREQVFIANILKCRPPDNRDPKPEEVAACAGNLQQQIRLVQPKIILALGRVAAQNLLKSKMSLGKLRGTVHKLDDIPLIVIYHPAYLLRSLLEKRKAWEDLQIAMRVYREIN